MPTSAPQVPLVDRIKVFVLSLQFVWFLGHLLLVFNSIQNLLFGVYSAYYGALFGALVSYFIVVYKTFGQRPSFSRIILQRMATDANLQYLIVAIYFYLNSTPISAILFTYLAFSVFHILSYIKDVVIPTVYPATAPQPASIPGILAGIRTFVGTYQPKALVYVAYWEILSVMPQLILHCFTRSQSPLAPIAFAQFLRMRYHLSTTYKNAFARIRLQIDTSLAPLENQQGALVHVWKAWVFFRDLLCKFGEVGNAQPQPQPDRAR